MIELGPELLLVAGPGLLAVMAWLETSSPVGLLVPAGVALALGAFLSHEGLLSMPLVVLASGTGAIAGDWTGYWFGRLRGTSVFHRAPGPLGRLVRRYAAPTAATILRRPFWSVALGRTVSFVRTLMPAAVGRSGMPFGRFVLLDLVGVTAWLVLYVGIGILAGASWRAASGVIGTGWALLLALVALGAWVASRLRHRREVREIVDRRAREASEAYAASRAESDAGPHDGPHEGPPDRPFQVGLTGNVASGKSTVARLWADAGVPVVSADELARRVVEPGTEGLAEVVRIFGDAVLTDEGELDRPGLRATVFADPEARARLEAVLHPRIAALRSAWVAERATEGHRLVVSEIPLLFEAGLEDQVDRIVLVDAPQGERLRRMVEGRGLAADEARAILDAQMDPAEKRPRAHHVVDNDGTLEALGARAAQVLADLRQEAGA
jgi:dephospho-CoA kinase